MGTYVFLCEVLVSDLKGKDSEQYIFHCLSNIFFHIIYLRMKPVPAFYGSFSRSVEIYVFGETSIQTH